MVMVNMKAVTAVTCSFLFLVIAPNVVGDKKTSYKGIPIILVPCNKGHCEAPFAYCDGSSGYCAPCSRYCPDDTFIQADTPQPCWPLCWVKTGYVKTAEEVIKTIKKVLEDSKKQRTKEVNETIERILQTKRETDGDVNMGVSEIISIISYVINCVFILIFIMIIIWNKDRIKKLIDRCIRKTQSNTPQSRSDLALNEPLTGDVDKDHIDKAETDSTCTSSSGRGSSLSSTGVNAWPGGHQNVPQPPAASGQQAGPQQPAASGQQAGPQPPAASGQQAGPQPQAASGHQQCSDERLKRVPDRNPQKNSYLCVSGRPDLQSNERHDVEVTIPEENAIGREDPSS